VEEINVKNIFLRCSCCIDTIKTIYGPDSKELDSFNRAIRSNPSSSWL